MDPGVLQVAVIGCGKVAQNLHLPALAKSNRCRLVAVCDASREVGRAVGRRYNVERVYDSIEHVLGDDQVAAVIISVGDPLHVSVAEEALARGKHVLVEKPLGVTAAECRPLQAAVEKTGLVLQVGVMKRHDPGLEFARDAIRQRIGELASFNLWYRASADQYVDESSVFLPVLRDQHYERPGYKLELEPYYLATHGAHLFDTARYLVGDPVKVQARLSIRGDIYSWHGLLHLADGALGSFELTVYIHGGWSEGATAFGDRGRVDVRLPNPFYLRPAEACFFDAATRTTREPLFSEGDPYLRQLEAFAASVLDGAPIRADVGDGIRALELIEAVARSAAHDGNEVDLRV